MGNAFMKPVLVMRHLRALTSRARRTQGSLTSQALNGKTVAERTTKHK